MENLLQQYKELRSEDIEKYTIAIRNPRKTALHRTRLIIREYVLKFFKDGINAYQHFFDHASIYYTSLAVELALLFKLRNIVKRKKEENPDLNITFNWLIDNSNLNDDTKRLANDVRIMRNCYVHYQNIIAYNAKLRLVDIPELIKQGILRPETADILSTDKDIIPIRIEHLETNEEIMPFINKRGHEHTEWIGSAITRMYALKKRNNDNSLLNMHEVLAVFGTEAFDALTCIKWSLNVLKALYII